MGEIKKIGVGVGVVILNEQKQILLGLRNPNKENKEGELTGSGLWTMPGGKVEIKETLSNAAIRETKEETGIEIENLELVAVLDDIEENSHYVTIGFMAKKYTGTPEVKEKDTIVEWKWFDLNNLPQNLYKPSKKILQNIKNNKIY